MYEKGYNSSGARPKEFTLLLDKLCESTARLF